MPRLTVPLLYVAVLLAAGSQVYAAFAKMTEELDRNAACLAVLTDSTSRYDCTKPASEDAMKDKLGTLYRAARP